MSLADIATLWRLEVTRTAKAPIIVAATLATPLTWLLLFGATFEAGTGATFQGFRYFTFVAPGLAVMVAMFYALAAGTVTMADRQGGFLKEVLVAPVDRMSIILGRTLGICTVVAMQAFLLLGIPALLGQGAPMPLGLLSLAGIALGLSLATLGFVGIGMVMGARGKNPQSFQGALGLITLPMFFLSGALVPVANLPDWARLAAMVNPMAYAVDIVRQSSLGTATAQFPLAFSVLGLLGFALLTLSAGARYLQER